MPEGVKRDLTHMLAQAGQPKVGLCISVFEASGDGCVAEVSKRDWWWYSGYMVAVIQVAIGIIPWAVWGQWDIFVITSAGTLVAFTTGSLPRWREERWKCRRTTKKICTLLRGNGSQHVLVILRQGRGLDLEDLAASGGGEGPLRWTRLMLSLLAICWIVLLITVSGIKGHTWCLVAIGTMGMVHTTAVTAAPRQPEYFGIHLKFRECFVSVIETLKAADKKCSDVGRSILSTFFPNGVRAEDAEWASRYVKP